MKARYSLAAFLLICQLSLLAQEREVTVDDYYVDFSVPDITAFSILDVSPNDVVRPGNVKEFAAGIVNYVSESGNLKPGLAIEFAPYRLFSKTKEQPSSTWLKNKSLKNLQLSIATAQGDSTNLLAAWGLNWTPVDKTDPVANKGLQNFFAKYISTPDEDVFPQSFLDQRNSHLGKVAKFFGSLNGEQKDIILDLFSGDYVDRIARYGQDSLAYVANMRKVVLSELQQMSFKADTAQDREILALITDNAELTFMTDKAEREFTKRFAEEVKNQKRIFLEENWNRLVVQFKAGAKYTADEGEVNRLSILNYRVFGGLAGRVPGFGNGEAANSRFAKNSQVVCQANYTSYRDGASIMNWEFSAGGRLLYGKADKRFSGEFLYSTASVKGETNESLEYIRYTVGGEMKVTEGLWFELAVGGQKFLQGDDSARVVPQFGIKYAVHKKSRF